MLAILYSTLFFLPSSTRRGGSNGAMLRGTRRLVDRCQFVRTRRLLGRDVGGLGHEQRSAVTRRSLLRRVDGLHSVVETARQLAVVSDVIMGGSAFLRDFGLDPRDKALRACRSFFRLPSAGRYAICLSRLKGGVCFSRPSRGRVLGLCADSLMGGR